MLVSIFVAVAKHGDEEQVVGVGNDARSVSNQMDMFTCHPDRIDWVAQMQEFRFDVAYVDGELKPIMLGEWPEEEIPEDDDKKPKDDKKGDKKDK